MSETFSFNFGDQHPTSNAPVASRPAEEVVAHQTPIIESEFEVVTFVNASVMRRRRITQDMLATHTEDGSFVRAAVAADIVPGVYEGGLKIWECTNDLVDYMAINSTLGIGPSTLVLELGCGHGLPGIQALRLGARVHFQDYNHEVIRVATIPNVLANGGIEQARFFAGDWTNLQSFLPEEYDVILASETLYYPEHNNILLSFIKHRLSRQGVAVFSAKTYYFGTGGGTTSFVRCVQQDACLTATVVQHVEDGTSSIREIVLLRWTQ